MLSIISKLLREIKNRRLDSGMNWSNDTITDSKYPRENKGLFCDENNLAAERCREANQDLSIRPRIRAISIGWERTRHVDSQNISEIDRTS